MRLSETPEVLEFNLLRGVKFMKTGYDSEWRLGHKLTRLKVEEFFCLIDFLDSFYFIWMFGGKNPLYPIFNGSNLNLTWFLFL